MRLGGSLKRRRGRRRVRTGSDLSNRITSGGRTGQKLMLTVAILLLVGWFSGYVLSTRVLFPPPRALVTFSKSRT